MGGILYRREEAGDLEEREKYEIPGIDLVIVDLYPFEEYVAKGATEEEIIEKIDIGGITLIRAAAKNFRDVIIVPGKDSYADLLELLRTKKGVSSIEDRRRFAAKAFLKSSGYDTHIFQYFNRKEGIPAFTASETRPTHLRYGENPHQKAMFYGSEDALPEQLHGKEISYNNMLDIEAALELISDFDRTAVAVIKHNNACGCAEGRGSDRPGSLERSPGGRPRIGIRRNHRFQQADRQGDRRGDAQDILRGCHCSGLFT